MPRSASACSPRSSIWSRSAASKPSSSPRDDSGWIPLDWLPPLDTLERIAHAMLLFGFPCMTVGLILGAVLVQETSLGAAYFRRPQGHRLLCHVGRSTSCSSICAQPPACAGAKPPIFPERFWSSCCASGPPTSSATFTGSVPHEPDRPHRRQPQNRAHRAARAHRHLARRSARSHPRPRRAARRHRVHDRLHLQPRRNAGRRRVA